MARKYREYTDSDAKLAASKSRSIASFLKNLNLTPAGGNYAHAKKTIQRLKIDCSHWKGQGWSQGERKKNWADYSRVSSLKKHLIKDRGHTCSICMHSRWNNSPIPLEVHHLNGDRTNNSPSNLQLLCANCHATTENYRGRKNIMVA